MSVKASAPRAILARKGAKTAADTMLVQENAETHATHARKNVIGNVGTKNVTDLAESHATENDVTSRVAKNVNVNTDASDCVANHVQHYAEFAIEKR